MGKRVRIVIRLFRCKTCGKRYNNRLTHVCRIHPGRTRR